MKKLNTTATGFKESIFSTMTKLARENNAINLSQGFPDFDGPAWIKEELTNAVNTEQIICNQYAPSFGNPKLLESIQKVNKKYKNLNFDTQGEILVTNGATEALFISALGLCNPGDEVIVFEPYYDSYVASIELAGATPVPVTLHAPEFKFNVEELKSAITSKTKFLYINTPHNPTGKMFAQEELEVIAKLANEHDFYVVSDEVYDFLTFDKKHIPPASLPSLKDRTITISSVGKTFGFTGWKIGWAAGPRELISALHSVHQFNVFSVHHPTQLAVANCLEKLDEYIPEFQKLYNDKRDLLFEGLKQSELEPIKPQGTYFIMAKIPSSYNDVEYCEKLIKEKKVATIPPSAFYSKSNEGSQYLRFCFAKKDETLKQAIQNLSS